MEARLFIFDEPTVGVDVGTKAEIYRLFAKLLKQGARSFSSPPTCPRSYELADRLHVFRSGQLVANHDFHAAMHEEVLSGNPIGVLKEQEGERKMTVTHTEIAAPPPRRKVQHPVRPDLIGLLAFLWILLGIVTASFWTPLNISIFCARAR